MTWQQGLLSGIILAVFAMILTPFALYFSLKYVNPDFFTNMINYSVSKGMKLENAQAMFDISAYMIFATFGTLSFGIIFAAVAAAIVKTKK
jgi:fatty acid desaturase